MFDEIWDKGIAWSSGGFTDRCHRNSGSKLEPRNGSTSSQSSIEMGIIAFDHARRETVAAAVADLTAKTAVVTRVAAVSFS